MAVSIPIPRGEAKASPLSIYMKDNLLCRGILLRKEKRGQVTVYRFLPGKSLQVTCMGKG